MPRSDPLPLPSAAHQPRLKRTLRLLALFALAVAALAALLVGRGQSEFHPHMFAATALGIGLAVFLGGGLTLLIFFNAASGHDGAAARHDPENDQ